tara:strand:- start:868 stop:1728 length:861 start_codon:yes stop_codon:yes gene_type:complete
MGAQILAQVTKLLGDDQVLLDTEMQILRDLTAASAASALSAAVRTTLLRPPPVTPSARASLEPLLLDEGWLDPKTYGDLGGAGAGCALTLVRFVRMIAEHQVPPSTSASRHPMPPRSSGGPHASVSLATRPRHDVIALPPRGILALLISLSRHPSPHAQVESGCVEQLLKAGARVDAAGADGDTSVHLACTHSIGQSGVLAVPRAGHHGLSGLHLKARGCSTHSGGETRHLRSHREAVAFPPEAAHVAIFALRPTMQARPRAPRCSSRSSSTARTPRRSTRRAPTG